MKIELSAQVAAFLEQVAPEPRRLVREGLRPLEHDGGDVRALEGAFAGFYRLRVGRYRVVFRYGSIGRQRLVRCEFAEERSIVYQLYAEMARHLQLERPEDAPRKD